MEAVSHRLHTQDPTSAKKRGFLEAIARNFEPNFELDVPGTRSPGKPGGDFGQWFQESCFPGSPPRGGAACEAPSDAPSRRGRYGASGGRAGGRPPPRESILESAPRRLPGKSIEVNPGNRFVVLEIPGVVVHQSQFRDQQVMTNWSNLRVRKLGHDPGHQVVMECHSP